LSKIEVDTVEPQSGTSLTLGASGDTITIPAGATFDSSAATTTLPATVVTTTGTQTLSNKTIDATQLTGTVATSNLGTGTADATTFLRGDQTYAAAGGGLVLQVLNATSTTETVMNNDTWVDVGITLAITPSAISSKVLITANASGCGKATSNTYLELRLLKDATVLAVIEQRGGYTADTSANKVGTISTSYLDSPSTTSATTYKLQGRSGSNNAYAQVGDSNPTHTITLMEISV
jgi:hypothetical protein